LAGSLFCDFVNGRYWYSGGVQSACPYSITRAENETCAHASGNLLRVGNGIDCISSPGFGSTFGSFTNLLLQSFFDGNVQSIVIRTPKPFPVSKPVAYYFDSVVGSDNNNCLSTRAPCASTTKMAALRYRGGDTINWKAGSSFTGCLALNANNVRNTTSANPITIQSYGSGETPIITSNCGAANSGSNGPKTAAVTLDSISATVNGIAVRGSGLTSGSATQCGIAAQNSSGSSSPSFVIENVDISGFGAPGATGDAGTDIFVTGFSEAAGFPTKCGNIQVSILNVTLHGSSTSSGEEPVVIPEGS
jgi:hypothetical protein